MRRDRVIWKTAGGLLLGMLLMLVVESIDRQRLVSTQRGLAAAELSRMSQALERELRAIVPLAEPLARQLALAPDMPAAQLRRLTSQLREQHPRVVNVAVSHGLRIVHVNPVAGNEAVLGMNFALRPEMMAGVRRAIERRATVLAGPLPLVQSGQPGVIARTPFFAAAEGEAAGELQGLVSVVVDLPGLLEDVGLLAADLPFVLAIRGREGLADKGEVFFGEAELFRHPELRCLVELPDGAWVIAAAMKPQGYPPQRQWWLRGGGALLTLVLVLLMLGYGTPAAPSRAPRRVALRWFLSLRLLLLLLPLVVVQGWLSYQAALNAAEQLQKQLAGEIGARVQDKVVEFFDAPRRVLGFNAEQARAGLLDLQQADALLGNFLLQLRQQPLLTFLSVGTAEGEYLAASRPPLGEDRALRILEARLQDGREMLLYRVDDANRRGSLVSRGNDFFDARSRPWFSRAREQGGMAWYPVYRYAINDQLGAYDAMGIGMAAPLHDGQERFIGVVTADVALVQLSRLLAEITRDTGGVAFLAEASGELLATSTQEAVYRLLGSEGVRIRSIDSENPLVRAMGQVIDELGTPEGRAFREVDGERYLVDWLSYVLPDGPTLTIGVALPQRQFLAPTSSLMRNLVLVAVAVLLFSLLAAVLLSNWIARPLAALSRWAVRLGSGHWSSEKPQDSPVSEVHALEEALVLMARSLACSNEELRRQVSERTAELEHANRELQQLSSTDGLTGLANRRMFDQVLEQEWARARRSSQPLALLMLDIDLFKHYNDCYGHLAGDDCLRQVAGLIHAHSRRASDLPARYGGEEFAVIAADIDVDGALSLAEGICRAIEAQAIAHARSPFARVTISVGVAVRVPQDGEGVAVLIHQADQALYRAKSGGRNRVVLAPGGQA